MGARHYDSKRREQSRMRIRIRRYIRIAAWLCSISALVAGGSLLLSRDYRSQVFERLPAWLWKTDNSNHGGSDVTKLAAQRPMTPAIVIPKMHVNTVAELGVQRLRIPGELRATGEAVLLHLWIRQTETSGSVALVGFGFVELVSQVLIYAHNILRQPEQGTDELRQPGFMKLHKARNDSPIATFQVDVAHDVEGSLHEQARPFWLEAVLPPQECSAVRAALGSVTYDIKVSNWRRFARFTMATSTEAMVACNQAGLATWPKGGWLAGPPKATPKLEAPSTKLVFVLKTLYDADVKALSLLIGHIVWHREAVGVAGYLIYIFPEHVAAVANNTFLTTLQQDGYLQFVLWDQEVTDHMITLGPAGNGTELNITQSTFKEQGPSTIELPNSFQTLAYNHAILLTTGRGVTLMIADLDEFMATPTNKSAAQIVRECLSDNVTSTIIPWRLVECGNCSGNEIDEWTDAFGTASAGNLLLTKHPLRRYWVSSDDQYQLTSPFAYGKSLVMPERTYMFRHHEGISRRGGRHERRAPCDAEILHAKSLFGPRIMESDTINHTAWQWPFARDYF